MTHDEGIENLKKLGITIRPDIDLPEDDQVEKVESLYTLIQEFVVSLVREGHLQFTPQHRPAAAGPQEDWIKDWIQEASEEYLFG